MRANLELARNGWKCSSPGNSWFNDSKMWQSKPSSHTADVGRLIRDVAALGLGALSPLFKVAVNNKINRCRDGAKVKIRPSLEGCRYEA